MKKRGQVTIFIIIAVVIIAMGGVTFLIFKGDSLTPSGSKGLNSNNIISTCLSEDLMNTIQTLSYQGGSINPGLNIKFKFGDEDYRNITYLCYSRDYYAPCISQQPVLINHEKSEIRNEIKDKVEECFMGLVDTAKKDYDVKYDYNGFDIEILPEHVNINIDGSLTYSKGDDSQTIKKFNIPFNTEFYSLTMLAQEISSQESNYCYFDRVGYMLYHPDIEIDAPFKVDDTKIYTLRHADTKEIFRFAIRSCAIPEGLM